MAYVAQPGSFRDPSGRVFVGDEGVFRTVSGYAQHAYEFVRDNRLLEDLARRGWVVESVEVDPAVLGASAREARYVLEHPAIPYVSFPYEWCFPALKSAALLHLDLHLEALERGATLSDSSAYNVQFRGARPVFIDVLSLRPYREGELWVGHRQFCEQFLNPLLLRAKLGAPHNAWYRGSLEGIATTDLARLLPLSAKLSWNVFAHVVLHARLHEKALKRPSESTEKARAGRLSRAGLQGLLSQLRRWIARLQPADRGASLWGDYASTHSYRAAEESAKRRFVAEFVGRTRPRLLLDLGCNTGDYSALA
ncbi:MAG: class I SAM-dependent methyltransferase, partial [Geminicoccales bacterium]